MLLSTVWTHFKASTTTLHNSPSSWYALLALWSTCVFVVVFISAFCNPGGNRCMTGQAAWDNSWWWTEGPAGGAVKEHACGPVFCEFCNDDWFVRQPINTYSNVSFVMVGLLMLVFGIEDYRYFARSGRFSSDSTPASDPLTPKSARGARHPLQDYSCTSPPNNLVFCGWPSAHFA